MKLSDCKTKVAKIDFLKAKLASDDRWMLKGLITIYQYQTAEEQRVETTSEHNGVGFTGIDGEILTSFANQCISRGIVSAFENASQPKSTHIYVEKYLSAKQAAILKQKMPKYARQLLKVAEMKEQQKAVAP
jgi:hypothetical protein